MISYFQLSDLIYPFISYFYTSQVVMSGYIGREQQLLRVRERKIHTE